MELVGARVLVVGSTGVLGTRISRALHRAGASLVLSGRDTAALSVLSRELGDVPVQRFEALELYGATVVVDAAARDLGGLDAVVVTLGVAAFGPTAADGAWAEHLLAVNALAPMALIRAALPHVLPDGTVAAISADLTVPPATEMPAYAAGKAALSSWLDVLRREHPTLTVFDIRPPHMDTGLVERALGTAPPALPAPVDVDGVVARIVAGLRDGDRELPTGSPEEIPA